MTTFADLVPSPAGRFDGIERPYTPEDVLRLRGKAQQQCGDNGKKELMDCKGGT